MTKGYNTSWVLNNDKLTLASNNQIAPRGKPQSTDGSSRDYQDDGLQHDDGITEESHVEADSTGANNDTMSEGMENAVPLRHSGRTKRKVVRYGIDEGGV